MKRYGNNLIICLLLVTWTGCAYFNTFYNAQQYFEDAEENRLEKVGESVPKNALDAYGKVIERSQKVLDKYPDSKFRYEAILLMGISHFHRGEIRKAEITFLNLEEEPGGSYILEAKFWQALCKWKLGKVQPAINELEALQQDVEDPKFKARILLARADIFLEEGLNKEAFETLEQAAALTRDPMERSQIYYQIASLAYRNSDYDLAYQANKQVLKSTISKARINEANLNIVQIRREQGKHRNVESLVKSLLADDQYKDIHGALELELGKMYLDKNTLPETIEQMSKIVRNYSKTSQSAEALFILGEIQLLTFHQLDSAKILFEKSVSEQSNSPVRQKAQAYVKEISAYLNEYKLLKQNLEGLYNPIESVIDTSRIDSARQLSSVIIDTIKLTADIAHSLYVLGELEAFHFDQPNSAEKYFEEIINYYRDNEYHPKALFTLSYLKYTLFDSIRAVELEDSILVNYPESDYADYILDLRGDTLESNILTQLLTSSETNWHLNRPLALKQYKQIIISDSTSAISARAAYFLAYHYDYTDNNADSALVYYIWLDQHHPLSDQNLAAKRRFQQLKSIFAPPKSAISEPTVIDTTGSNDN